MQNYLIIGGAGFIGSNIASYLCSVGKSVTILDNFSRRGTDLNLKWLQTSYPDIKVVKADVRHDLDKLNEAVAQNEVVYHLAAQVAVTTSVKNPREDFEINALGTFNVLEAARLSARKPIVIFSSTNKVYGGMEDVKIVHDEKRYSYADYPLGIPEDRLLDFHSPYGCSKGTGDQYVRDYARIYDIPTVVFRQSCIYGTHQFGLEDQGWVAWFTIASLLSKPLKIYGDGKQVRDVLFVDDLVRAFVSATDNIEKTKGKIFNIGGGASYTMSLLELVSYLEEFLGQKITYSFADWRPGDQPVYISDVRKAKEVFGWQPQIDVKQGVSKLVFWVKENRAMIEDVFKDM
ncbi:MAG: GDP-mannose 4,6-dehydratase [Patescibacteria group bacterium]|jgi:CDP-paratose 2-epimerase